METGLKVTGMTCGVCVNHVTNALQGVNGVTTAEVDLNTGRATVQHKTTTTTAGLVQAVEDDGCQAQVLTAATSPPSE